MTPRRNLRPVPLDGPTIKWTIAAITLAPGPTNPAARELWDLITSGPPGKRTSRRT